MRTQAGARDNAILLQAKVDTLTTKLTFAEAERKEQEKGFAAEYEMWASKHARVQAKHDECAALPLLLHLSPSVVFRTLSTPLIVSFEPGEIIPKVAACCAAVQAAGAPRVDAHAQNREMYACAASVCSSHAVCC